MSNKVDFAIVGAGIVGLAFAYKLQLKYPNKSIVILEKESELGQHQTGRNSGVIHSGIYYKPGSYKAKNCKNGHQQLVRYAEKHHVPFDLCGKVIVATEEQELPLLDEIYKRGLENETEGIRFLTSEEILEKEPFIKGLKAIWVPTAGIINYVDLSKSFVEQIENINPKSKLLKSCELTHIETTHENTQLESSLGEIVANKVVFCTGLQADRTAEKDDLKLDMHIVGFRGDYYELKPEAKHKIKNLVYPVPDPKFPFLGVHFTRMIEGGVECGPNAVFTFKREGYNRTSFSLKDTWEAFVFTGTWKLFRKHWRKGMGEYKRAFSKRLFVKALKKLMPSITVDDVQMARAGVRAQAIDYQGALVDDFKIMKHDNNVHVLNAPSPAATSCLAIADEILKCID